jgi:hypothetical protein
MSTVFVLGAGASKAMFGLPLMNNFFSNYKPEIYPNLQKFLERYFRYSLDNGVNINMEEVTTCLALQSDRVGSFGQIELPELRLAREEFNNYVFETLNSPVPNENIDKLFEEIGLDLKSFSNDLDDKQNIITFNYDLGIDRLLYKVSNKSYNNLASGTILTRLKMLLGQTDTYGGPRPSLFWKYRNSGVYLKLHGSLDWLYCPNEQCFHHQIFFPNQSENEDFNDKVCYPCGLCGSPLAPVIIPPSLLKTFDLFPKLSLFWHLAYKKLVQAERVVVIGLSFAASDYYLRWLFKNSLAPRFGDNPPRIEIVDVSCKPKEILTEITGVPVIFRDDLIELLQT